MADTLQQWELNHIYAVLTNQHVKAGIVIELCFSHLSHRRPGFPTHNTTGYAELTVFFLVSNPGNARADIETPVVAPFYGGDTTRFLLSSSAITQIAFSFDIVPSHHTESWTIA
ncbi:MAG: hypothetical protein GY703_04905 [Gammaproteobacteria bacterium]|nr:hypothetical protein [Gammaproteobacteria bacterium]